MNTPEEIQSMVDARSYCVVGASRDPRKYGYQVYRAIKSEGKKVYPVNPNAELIGNSVCYASVKDLPETVDVAVFVVPEDVVEETVPECHALGIKNIWMQPGAESRAAIDYCEAHGIPVVAGECIMIRFRTEIDDDM
jgi:hypothetical protein